MAKSNGDRSAQTSKAGKRHGSITYPLPASSEKLAAREGGERQFVAKHQLSVEKEIVKYDEKQQRFVTRVVNVPVDYQYDPTRRRLVTSPVIQKKKGRG